VWDYRLWIQGVYESKLEIFSDCNENCSNLLLFRMFLKLLWACGSSLRISALLDNNNNKPSSSKK